MTARIIAPLALLLVGPAMAQVPVNLGQPGGAAQVQPDGGLVLSGQTVNTQTLNNPMAAGRYTTNSDNVTVNIAPGAQGVGIGRYTQVFAGGTGALGGGGHLIGLMGQANLLNYTHQPLTVGLEGQLQNNGTLDNAWGVASHMIANYGSIGGYVSFAEAPIDVASGGSYGTVATLACTSFGPIPNLTGTARCVDNQDPLRPIVSMAPFIGSLGEELAPASPGRVMGRYYYGVQPVVTGPSNYVLVNARFYGMFYNPTQTTYTKIGINIAIAGGSSDTCSLNIYAGLNGGPAGAPLMVTQTVSAAAIGDVEATGIFKLDAGFYFPAVFCSSSAIGLRTYQDIGAVAALGDSTSNSMSLVPYTGNTGSFPINPGPMSYTLGANYRSQQVQIWFRR